MRPDQREGRSSELGRKAGAEQLTSHRTGFLRKKRLGWLTKVGMVARRRRWSMDLERKKEKERGDGS